MLGSFSLVYFFIACVNMDMERDALAMGGCLGGGSPLLGTLGTGAEYPCQKGLGSASCHSIWAVGPAQDKDMASLTHPTHQKHSYSPWVFLLGLVHAGRGWSMGCRSSEPQFPLHQADFLLLITMRKFL